MSYRVRPMSAEDGESIALWRYPGPWAVYDGTEPVHADEGFFAVVDDEDGGLVGFACLGLEARVPGLGEVAGVLDVGVGMRPDLTGQGRGREFAAAVLKHARGAAADASATRFRAVVQEWNRRSLRLLERLGFTEVARHVVPEQGVTYVVLSRPTAYAEGERG
ncbi:MAG: [ribosomal protein S18]-alanine N-acetyltransferase [Actinomycetota bacterium]|jgi:RimJ/RimL family protein N-acetyltransferase|nr:[ribosomal protein S18]-alanine N-acetyltransferase [Actinomycetota bacterium]